MEQQQTAVGGKASVCRKFESVVIMSKILQLAANINFYLYRKPVKMSRSFDGLTAVICTGLDKNIINGDVFIFLSRQKDNNQDLCL
jgi:hypothetical protein